MAVTRQVLSLESVDGNIVRRARIKFISDSPAKNITLNITQDFTLDPPQNILEPHPKFDVIFIPAILQSFTDILNKTVSAVQAAEGLSTVRESRRY